jgi:hypothetical protein
MRKRCHRRIRPALPPKGLRPKLTAAQVRDLDTTHLQTLDDIANGRGTEASLQQWAGAVATWLNVAQMVGIGVPEMQQQADVVESLTARFNKTGRVLFSGPELQRARVGVAVMNELAVLTDASTARVAADIAEATLQPKEPN